MALTSGGTGLHGSQSLRRAYPQLKRDGVVDVCRETVRLALLNAEWSCQPVVASLPLDDALVLRESFCRSNARTIAAATMFTDSKYFEGALSRKSKLGRAWAPNGAPVELKLPAHAPYKLHAYAGITRYGATPLFEAAGTTLG